MAATFDATLSTPKDWVRFLIGDRDVDGDSTSAQGRGPRLSDEEIAALLVEEKNKYLAAARAGDVILAQGRDVVEKAVGDLKIKYGDNPETAYRSHLKRLREKGCELLLKTSGSHVLRNL